MKLKITIFICLALIAGTVYLWMFQELSGVYVVGATLGVALTILSLISSNGRG